MSCRKHRCRSRDEARENARRIEREEGYPPGTLVHYRCRSCPFWHVARARPWERGQHGDKGRPHDYSIGARVAPGTIETLLARAGAR